MCITNEVLYALLAEILILAPNCAHIGLSSQIDSTMRLPLCLVSAVFLVFNSFFLIATIFKDPGKMPKNYSTFDEPVVVKIGEQTFTMKPCTTCKSLKNLRTHHCKVCDYCVDRLDHHCPWVANCIGRGNHRLFLMLLICCTLNAVYMLVVNVVEMGMLKPPPGKFGGEIILVVYSVVMGWSVGSLLAYQLFLVCKNLTTHEHRRRLFSNNPFASGVWKNCAAFWKMEEVTGTVVVSDNRT
jgi:hypothetical protein